MATTLNNDDQKKRMLDAIERRLKQSEAEIRFPQQKDKKRPLAEKGKPPQDNKPSCKVASTVVSSVSAIKGNVLFPEYGATQDLHLNNSAYCELFHPVNENLAAADKITDPKSTVHNILNDYFQRGDAAPKFFQGFGSMKQTDKKILLDNFVKQGDDSGAGQSRALKRHAKRSQRHASRKKHKKLGSFDLPTEYYNFEQFRPLCERWKSYISQFVKNMGDDPGKYLFNADLHGAIILVAQCKVSSLSGIRGIIIRETTETFGIITPNNKFQVVPKKLSVFMLQAGKWKVTLHGDKL